MKRLLDLVQSTHKSCYSNDSHLRPRDYRF
jgi:hypothetical protein